ncbi:hypothetical protein G4177_21960 [Corallococcus sp. ZKHCc1 1396]|uniref:Uncharacterized protein n=1 Tax=Corallococcus soli TaxID=2710757 RepID=A0ABR9PSK1_9BACT|nr:hypothetical protein [Corallococcus soli]MBE4750839.1 hypothetical protein [Corallococcus soli]
MSIQEAVVAIMLTVLIGIPFLGLTLRFALKPLVDTWLRVREAQAGGARGPELEALRARVAHLEYMLDLHGMLERPVTPTLGSPEPLERLAPVARLGRERV